MIIKRLILHNFGVYASTNMFEFKGKNPIVLIGGMNGRGKTTFLEAVLLALYGANSFAYNESKYKTFGQYLKSFVNVADGTLKTYVDLEFSMDASDNEIYNVHREWTGDKKRTTEKIQVYKNHEYNQFLTDNWTMFIENILPSGLSNFFFFDGEKIAELAVEKTSTQMKESIKALLGISVIDLLKSDLGRILNRIEKNKVGNSEATQIELLRDKKNMATVALENIDNEIEELISNKTAMQHELEILKQEYIARGGDIVTQRQDLFKKKSTVASKIENFREQLISDASSELPLVLVKELLRNIRENAEIEQDNKMLDIALRKMSRFSTDYKEENKFDSEAVARFMNFVNEKSRKKKYSVSYNLSDTALFKLQILLDEQLLDTKLNVKGHQDILEKLQMEADQLDNYLSVDIDEKAIAQIYKEIKVLEQKLIEIDVVLSRKNEERKTKNGVLLTSTAEFNKKVESYLKKMELNDDSDRIIKYSHMADTILDEYKIRLQKNKIAIVAETVTLCYKQLANKKNLIDRIEMDPVTLDLMYVDYTGNEVAKSSLSAGEKQLMVISLLWALALCSKKKLPVIIDTPLSRLDSAHRTSLIQTYFPQASEQIIILSTDSEIDYNYYQMMKKDIGDEFTLIYDDLTKSTTIRKGYFMEVEE
ncbi:MAG: DNA sulfur modification protein DndD [Faecalicoccus sp.]|uniref:DNA sulfur modification protein DndD n=1 Tax=Faecalicoccus sp. TaxID=1971758 RepID=UPI002A838CCB|nr:DNA sulfur modification protein DndD [Faecalicoccus sp.]MCI7179836.1 DNA sulfur modification protein DndD [Lachnospiraceae bacterium]MDY4279418.1 DNA sulfur modification protein DndD [Faecalicoccus sp.]MDY4670440.1 DNA sulfur modification protein DndD [Oliverpabstia sp.]MDY5620738.1 DNA sulfur modification protein DndD [Lachnospiraceae bacterium]